LLTLFKRLFKLSDVDAKSVDIATEQDDLESILKSSVPGLVSSSKRPIGPSSNDSNQFYDGAATGHKLLVEPSVFNMGLFLPPSLSFLQRLKEIVPPGYAPSYSKPSSVLRILDPTLS
jgi:exocyst complex component 4